MTELEKQEELAQAAVNLVHDWYNKNWEVGFPAHEHKCTFQLLEKNRRIARKWCKKWLENHPYLNEIYKKDTEFGLPCDYCEMMNFICVNNEGRIATMYRHVKNI